MALICKYYWENNPLIADEEDLNSNGELRKYLGPKEFCTYDDGVSRPTSCGGNEEECTHICHLTEILEVLNSLPSHPQRLERAIRTAERLRALEEG